ncbi:hypothetical protein BH18ACI2_BH18ACI2_04800 [soil metagenome]
MIMFKSKERRQLDERLDRFGRELLRSAAVSEAEAEVVASSPFLYARVRARIAVERERRAAGENWLSLLTVAQRAVPAMALSAALAFGMFWFGSGDNLFEPSVIEEALFAANDTRIERVVFAERGTLSNDDMLETILNDGELEASR